MAWICDRLLRLSYVIYFETFSNPALNEMTFKGKPTSSGAEAEAKAESYSAANGGRRGAMIVDVVVSRQRKTAGES